MKLILTIAILTSITAYSQEWQTIPGSYFNGANVLWGTNGFTQFAHMFGINKYDNSLWISNGSSMINLKDDGSYVFHADSNNVLITDNYFWEFEFDDTYTYVVSSSSGLYRYDEASWSHYYLEGAEYISIDEDSLFVSRGTGNSLKFVNFSPTNLIAPSNLLRIESRDGYSWAATGNYGNGNTVRYYPQTSSYDWYTPSNSDIISYTNNDFKFSPNNDSLFIASDKGLSIAYQDIFVDSITPNNTSNMPLLDVLEFEFDSQDNIWAVFGSDHTSPEKIAYLDRSTNTWTQIYDSSNSPVDFSIRLSIEVDTNNNLWVATKYNLYVLKINNWPDWLGSELLYQDKLNIYPNPVNDLLNLEGVNFDQVENLEIINVLGETVPSNLIIASPQSIDVTAIPTGVYYLRISDSISNTTIKFVKK